MILPTMDSTARQAAVDALYEALSTGARRIVFQDRILEFNTPNEIKQAIAELNRIDDAANPTLSNNAPPRQIRVIMKGNGY